MLRARVTSVLLATAMLVVAPVRAADDDASDAVYRDARAALVARLAALGAWCESHNCGAEHDAAYELVLSFEPDDATARKELRYVRDKSGGWTRTSTPTPSPTTPTRAAEAAERRDAAVREYRDAALELLLGAKLDVVRHERLVDELLFVDPNCPEARSANHERRFNGRWLLEETLVAKERRAALAKTVADARRAAKTPVSATAPAHARALVPNCGPEVSSEFVRVIGGPGTNESAEVVKVVDVSRVLFEKAFGTNAPVIPGYRLWLFASPGEGVAAMDRDPRFAAGDRAFFRTLSAGWIAKGAECFIWPEDAPSRVELSMRQTVGGFVRIAFGVGVKHGWAWEGPGHWFSDVVLGAHRCFFTRQSEYGAPTDHAQDELKARLAAANSDWLAEARALEASPRWPDFRVLVGREVNVMTPEDVVVAYALSRFFIEGRPAAEFPEVLRAVGKGDGPDAWASACAGTSLHHLELRLKRWLREAK